VANDDLPESYQEYLETIYRLQNARKKKKSNLWVTNHEIATFLGIKAPSVTEMLGKLEKRNLITWKRRLGVQLSESGEQMGARVLKYHRLLEEFFTKVLEIKEKDLMHRVACVLEHLLVAEPAFLEAIETSIEKFDNS
jgi:DtxR family Mn-dependent transcriptional regulator